MSKADRRATLIDACIRVARRQGLAATSGRDVAAESGTSVGLLHHYFGSVDSLLAAAFEQVERTDLETAREEVQKADSPARQLLSLVDFFSPAAGDWRYKWWIDAWSLAPERPRLQEAARQLNLEWRNLIRQVLVRGVEQGEFVCPDVDAAAWRILVQLDGLHLHASTGQIDASTSELQSWTTAALAAEVGLDGLDRS